MKRTLQFGRPTLYPWDKWYNGKEKRFTLRRGKDFKIAPYLMAQAFRSRAHRHNQVTRTLVYEKHIEVLITVEKFPPNKRRVVKK